MSSGQILPRDPELRTLDTMNDIAYCPKPECLSPTVRQDLNDNNAVCGQCRYEFCTKCEKDSHEGLSSTHSLRIKMRVYADHFII